MQKQRPTYATALRVDMKLFASLASFYCGRDPRANNAGGLARCALEDYASILIKEGQCQVFDSNSDAYEYLKEVAIQNTGRSVRVAGALMEQLGLETKVSEGIKNLTPEDMPAVTNETFDEIRERVLKGLNSAD